MDIRILVVDDQLTRKESYQWVCTTIGQKSSLSIALDFVSDPDCLVPRLESGGYSAILVDGVLTGNKPHNWPERQDLKWVLGQIHQYAPTVPMALVSSNWGDINLDAINSAWSLINCRALIRWEDIESKNSFVVSILQTLIYMKAGLVGSGNIQQGKPINILHLSDLQFGGFDEKRLEQEAASLAERILEYTNNEPPHFIALTGDIAEHGFPSEYRSAQTWLSSLCNRLGFKEIPRDRIWIVPGNHDVNMALGAASRITVAGSTDAKGNSVDGPSTIKFNETLQHNELLEFAYEPYKRFVNSVSNM